MLGLLFAPSQRRREALPDVGSSWPSCTRPRVVKYSLLRSMIPQVKWWRAKALPALGPGRADWFAQQNAYPGFVVSQPPNKGIVRLFRDLDAFKSHDGSF